MEIPRSWTLLFALVVLGTACARDPGKNCSHFATCADAMVDASVVDELDLLPSPDLVLAPDLVEPETDMAVMGKWVRKNSGTNASLRAVWGNGADDVFVVGNTPQVVLRSVDRGKTWRQCAVPPEGKLTAVTLDPASGVYVSTPNVYKSADHGKTWVLQTLGVSCCSQLTAEPGGSIWGAFSEDAVVFSRDQGKTWISLTKDPNAQHRGERVLTVGAGIPSPTVFLAGNLDALASSDFGKSWLAHRDPSWFFAGGWALSGYEGLLTGSFEKTPPYELLVVRTQDGGRTWSRLLTNVFDEAGSGIWGEGDNILVITAKGKIVRSRDRGVRWTVEFNAGSQLNAIWASSSSDVYAVGDGGQILHLE